MSSAVIMCMGCNWTTDDWKEKHDCPRHPDNLEKEIAKLRGALARAHAEGKLEGKAEGLEAAARLLVNTDYWSLDRAETARRIRSMIPAAPQPAPAAGQKGDG